MPRVRERPEHARGPVKKPPEEPSETKVPGVPSHLQAAVRDLLSGAAEPPAKSTDSNERK